MEKDDVIAALREMADLLEITDANAFEVAAYRNGAQGLDEWFGDLDQAVSDSTLTDIPSIGKGLSQVISDLVRSGSSQELDRVRTLVPPDLPVLLRIRGLGPKRVRMLWQELEIAGPDDLSRALQDGRVESLRGFGGKTVERIQSGLDFLKEAPARAAKSAKPAKATRPPMPDAPPASGRFWAGTSGYSYPKWKGGFYPDDARTDEFLQHYADRLATVEINNTFYRFPSPSVIEQWNAQTPANFHFAIKAHRRITHQLRLRPTARDHLVEFVERCGQLGSRLGCILFQLPPDLVRDDSRLDMLLASLPPGPRYAIEFRHETWFEADVQKKLAMSNIACVSGDAENLAPRQFVTANFVYVRLRRSRYSERELATWDAWFQAQTTAQRDVLVYLKHDDAGSVAEDISNRWERKQPSAERDMLRTSLATPRRKTARTRRKTG